MTRGSVTECLAINPDEFEDQFYLLQEDAPKGKSFEVIKVHMGTVGKFDNSILETARTMDFQRNWGDSAVIKSLLKHSDFAESLKDPREKVSPTIYKEAAELARGFQSFEATAPILQRNMEYQKKLTGTYKDTPIHGTPDLVEVTDTTVQMFDMKVTGHEIDRAARNARWDIQGAFYNELLKENYPNKEVLPPVFIVGGTKFPSRPRVFELPEDVIKKGKYGTEYVEGFEKLIERWNFHSKSGKWDMPMEYYQGSIPKLRI